MSFAALADVLTSEGLKARSVLKCSKNEEEPGAHLGVIGGERERRSNAPDSLIVPV